MEDAGPSLVLGPSLVQLQDCPQHKGGRACVTTIKVSQEPPMAGCSRSWLPFTMSHCGFPAWHPYLPGLWGAGRRLLQGAWVLLPCPIHILDEIWYFSSLGGSHADLWEMVPHCDFDFHFPNDSSCWAPFCAPAGHPYVFGKMYIEVLCPFLSQVVFCSRFLEFLIYFSC